MKLLKRLVQIVAIFAFPVLSQDDEAADTMRNVELGMAGLKEATKNPALLAQLMQDLQNPEMMAEAKKMMEDPDFQKQMKELSQNHAFKEATKKSIDMLKDPTESARVEAQMEHMMKIGEEKLKKGAANVMEEAMASMGNPEVMAKMTDMLKDPAFQQQIAKMAQDPSFKNYINAMKDMMKDPEKKQRFEELSEQLRSSKS